MLTLYGYPKTRSLRVSWLLEELGLPWQYHCVDVQAGDHRSPAFLHINPCGKVPALRLGDQVITESSAILLWLAEKYAPGIWVPAPGSVDAGLHHQWVAFITTELEQPLWQTAKHEFALPKDYRLNGMANVAAWEFDRAAAVAEAWLPASACLLGEQPTVADILLAHTLNWAAKAGFSLPDNLDAFRRHLSQRPAMRAGLSREMAGLERGASSQ